MVQVKDKFLVAAMAPPGGGRQTGLPVLFLMESPQMPSLTKTGQVLSSCFPQELTVHFDSELTLF